MINSLDDKIDTLTQSNEKLILCVGKLIDHIDNLTDCIIALDAKVNDYESSTRTNRSH